MQQMKTRELTPKERERPEKTKGEEAVTRKEEGQPFSQGGWPLAFFTVHRTCTHPEGGRLSSSVSVLWQKPKTLWWLNEPQLSPGDATGGAPDLLRR
jgi:hypothetical protein